MEKRSRTGINLNPYSRNVLETSRDLLKRRTFELLKSFIADAPTKSNSVKERITVKMDEHMNIIFWEPEDLTTHALHKPYAFLSLSGRHLCLFKCVIRKQIWYPYHNRVRQPENRSLSISWLAFPWIHRPKMIKVILNKRLRGWEKRKKVDRRRKVEDEEGKNSLSF